MSAEDNNETPIPSYDENTPIPGKVVTERAIERFEEEQEYVSVIIKRNDENSKHPDDVLQSAIDEGLEQVKKTKFSLFLSAVSAGLILGFAAMAVSFIVSILPIDATEGHKRLAAAVFYPLGFIICILSRTELFTEHTALAVYPALDKVCSFTRVIRLWVLVLLGNLAGTVISSFLLYMAEPVIQAKTGYLYVAEHLLSYSGIEILVSAILAGWLMALGGWIIIGMYVSSSQILCIYIVTFMIGIGGLHHSIAGSAEVFTAFLIGSNAVTISDIMHFLSFAVPGNLIGGSFFVAALNYAHIRKTQKYNMSKK